MTCVIAIIDNNKLIIGSDTRMSDSSGHFIDVNEAKILSKNINKNQKLIIGWAGDVKIGNVLTSFRPPKIKNTQYDKYIQTTFIEALKKKIKTAKIDKEEIDFTLMVCVNNCIYEISNDLSVVKISRNYHAIGSGSIAALTSLNLFIPYQNILNLNSEKLIKEIISSISKIINDVSEKSIVITI